MVIREMVFQTFLSADNCIVEGNRQKPITKKKVAGWLTLDREDFDNGMVQGWDRNQELIDFEFIPPTIVLEIMEQYNGQTPPNRSGLFKLFCEA